MSYEQIASIYHADMGASMRMNDIGYYLRQALRIGGRVLELGCGNGRILTALRAAGVDVVGIDRSRPMLQGARDALGSSQHLLQMEMRALGLRSAFDLALMPYSVATYLLDAADWKALAAGLRPALRPGGRVILDAFVPQPGLVNRGWLRDYARLQPQGWLVRHKRIECLGNGVHRIERRYRLHAAFDGRTLQTTEHIRPYSPEALIEHGRCYFGQLEHCCWDYDETAAAGTARFCTLTFRC